MRKPGSTKFRKPVFNLQRFTEGKKAAALIDPYPAFGRKIFGQQVLIFQVHAAK
jgi:hypothetical protein